MKVEQKIIIIIPIGRFIISAKFENYGEELYDGRIEKDNKVIQWLNVPKDETIIAPINIYKSSINAIDILLLEETEYKINFELNNELNHEDLDIFNIFRKYDSNEQIFKLVTLDGGLLNTKGYVGKIFLDVSLGSFKYNLPIEIRSKKVDYDSEYIYMIEDLSKIFIDLVFSLNSPLFQPNSLVKIDKENYYFYFIMLTYLFKKENLPFIFEYLSKNLYSILKNKNEAVPLSLVSNIDVNTLDLLVSDFSNLQESSNGFKVFSINNINYVPLEVFEVNYIDYVDVPENRFFKYFLEFVEQLINELLKYINSGYAFDNLLTYKHRINYYLSKNLFRDISKMNYIPLNSQVLQKREGYRELFQFYIMFEMGLNFSWNDLTNNFKSYQKQLHYIYEYWCYFKILSVIEGITGYKVPSKIFINENKFAMNLENGKIVKFPAFMKNNKKVEITLLYNKPFVRNSEFNSYSVCLKPDYSIQLKIGGKIRYLHFDAKYRVTKHGLYQSGDIDKMHTYKDAILNSIGAYVLYPGSGDYILFYDEKMNCDVLNKYDGTLAVLSKFNYRWSNNGVGAFSLKPGKNKNEDNLMQFIEFMINYECNLY